MLLSLRAWASQRVHSYRALGGFRCDSALEGLGSEGCVVKREVLPMNPTWAVVNLMGYLGYTT